MIRESGRYHIHEYKNVDAKTWRYATILDYVRQAREEAANFATHRGLPVESVRYAAVLKVHGQGPADGLVAMPMSEYARLLDRG